MLSESALGWRFVADCFRADCESGLVREGEVLALPNGYEATYQDGRVVVTAHHYDADAASWATKVAEWEVTRDGDGK